MTLRRRSVTTVARLRRLVVLDVASLWIASWCGNRSGCAVAASATTIPVVDDDDDLALRAAAAAAADAFANVGRAHNDVFDELARRYGGNGSAAATTSRRPRNRATMLRDVREIVASLRDDDDDRSYPYPSYDDEHVLYPSDFDLDDDDDADDDDAGSARRSLDEVSSALRRPHAASNTTTKTTIESVVAELTATRDRLRGELAAATTTTRWWRAAAALTGASVAAESARLWSDVYRDDRHPLFGLHHPEYYHRRGATTTTTSEDESDRRTVNEGGDDDDVTTVYNDDADRPRDDDDDDNDGNAESDSSSGGFPEIGGGPLWPVEFAWALVYGTIVNDVRGGVVGILQSVVADPGLLLSGNVTVLLDNALTTSVQESASYVLSIPFLEGDGDGL